MSLKVIRFLFAAVISLALALPAFPALASDASKADASKPWIKVVSPNGGEVLTAGDIYRITWESSTKIEKVSLWYKSCFLCFHKIAVNILNTGYYDWTVDVGKTSRTQFRIYLVGYEKGRKFAFDQSDAPFTALPFAPPTPTAMPTSTNTATPIPTDTDTPTPTDTATPTPTDTATPTLPATPTPTGSWLHLSYPNGGEDLRVGHTYRIAWESSPDVTIVQINLSSHYTNPACGDTEWDLEGMLVFPLDNVGYFDWTIPDGLDPLCKEFSLGVYGYYLNEEETQFIYLAGDSTVAPFTISYDVPPTSTPTPTDTPTPPPGALIIVNWPNGGETLRTWTTYQITWYSPGVEKVRIKLLKRLLCDGCPAGWTIGAWIVYEPMDNVGGYLWSIPYEGYKGDEFKILIEGLNGDGGLMGAWDESDGPFTIEPYSP